MHWCNSKACVTSRELLISLSDQYLISYLAFWGPTVSSVKEDDALSCASSMEPDSMPSGAMHCAAKSRRKFGH